MYHMQKEFNFRTNQGPEISSDEQYSELHVHILPGAAKFLHFILFYYNKLKFTCIRKLQ